MVTSVSGSQVGISTPPYGSLASASSTIKAASTRDDGTRSDAGADHSPCRPRLPRRQHLTWRQEPHPLCRRPSFGLGGQALDALARERDLVIVVSAGNAGSRTPPHPWGARHDEMLTTYPAYLTSPQNRVLDPAIAANVLTVGALAHSNGLLDDDGDGPGPRDRGSRRAVPNRSAADPASVAPSSRISVITAAPSFLTATRPGCCKEEVAPQFQTVR